MANTDNIKNNIFISFNCKSLKRSKECIKALCKTADVLALQETWLLPHDLSLLGQIDPDFAYTGKSAVHTDDGILRGRPYGGVAILWRKSVFPNVTVLQCDSERIAAIKVVNSDNRPILIFSVYMPTDCSDNLPALTQCLGELYAIVESSAIEAVYMLGDFNAHPGELFWHELINFCSENEWVCADVEKLGIASATYTYISEVYGCKRWLDHCLVSRAAWQTVCNIKPHHDVYWSDHFPLEIECNLGIVRAKLQGTYCYYNNVTWGVRNSEEIAKYHAICNNKLKKILFPQAFQNGMCFNSNHQCEIDNLYNNVVHVLCEAAKMSRIIRPKLVGKGKRVAGWNKHVLAAHRQARQSFKMYVLNGKPESGAIYEKMRHDRSIFKSRLRWCLNHQEEIAMDKLASYHALKKFDKFWKGTKKLNCKPSLPVSVEGVCEPRAIANLFRKHFTIESPIAISEPLNGTENRVTMKPHIHFTCKQVAKIIDNMKRGKSPGHDGLSIEHLQHAGVHLPRVLSMLFTLCVRHSYLPKDLMKTVVVPIVKNTTGDISDINNYRPISLATTIAKVLDSLLDAYLSVYIKLHDNQFGFRPGLSTESAILTLKHTVEYYTKRKTNVYACFMDLSKAFDLVIYDLLWSKLGEEGVPPDLVKIFSYWYKNQINIVKWADAYSNTYTLDCGVRQGGLTSPRLFNLYINQLIVELSSTHMGCFIDDVGVNNISYADDMVLLSPSIGGLKKLLGICESYVRKHGLKYNPNKTEILVFKCDSKGPGYVPPVTLNGLPIKRVPQFKYLGHIVNEALTDDLDIERERRALAVRGNMLARRFARCTCEVKISLFKAFCQTFYTSSLWVNFTKRVYNALRVQYNNIFRALLRLPRYCSASGMFADAKMDDFFAIIRKKSASLVRRVRGSRNRVLGVIADRVDSSMMGRFTELHLKGAFR